MIRAIVGACFVMLCSCGGDDDRGAKLDGAWTLENEEDDYDCVGYLVISGDEYEVGQGCTLEGGGRGLSAERGTFKVDGGSFTTKPTHSSCADADVESEKWDYEVNGNQLTLSSPDGILVLTRAEEPPNDSSLAAQYGCYDDDNFFSARPMTRI